MVAVLSIAVVRAGSVWAVTVNVTVPPTGRSADVAIAPEPLDAATVAPPAVTAVHEKPVTPAGMASAIWAPVESVGPVFETTIV